MSTGKEIQRLDKRDKAILEYIKKNSGTTEHQIVEYLRINKISSKLTTLKKIRQLKQKNEITDSLKGGQSGFHHYSINKDSDFNRINAKLSEVEILINDFEKYHNLVIQLRQQKYIPIEQLVIVEGSCLVGLNTILIQLLGKTNEVIKSEKDSQILFRKITQLLDELYQITEGAGILLDIFDMSKDTLEPMINKLESKSKEKVPKSEYKYVHESLEIMRNIGEVLEKMTKSIAKMTLEFKSERSV